MTRLLNTICAAATAVFLVAAPAIAADRLSPVGSWQLSTGESRYKVTECGDNGEICAKLVWLRDDAQTAENLQYLNTYVVKGARPASGNKWKGTVVYEGEAVGGSMQMLNGDTLRMTGCKMLCTTLEFTRI